VSTWTISTTCSPPQPGHGSRSTPWPGIGAAVPSSTTRTLVGGVPAFRRVRVPGVDGALRESLGALVGERLRTGNGQRFLVAGFDGRYVRVAGPTARRGRIPARALEAAAAAAATGRWPPTGGFSGQRPRVLAILEAAGLAPRAAR
jgi:hypothetical protein